MDEHGSPDGAVRAYAAGAPEAARAGADAGGTAEAEETIILERLWHAALALISACRSYGWDDAEIRRLATTVSALEARVRG